MWKQLTPASANNGTSFASQFKYRYLQRLTLTQIPDNVKAGIDAGVVIYHVLCVYKWAESESQSDPEA